MMSSSRRYPRRTEDDDDGDESEFADEAVEADDDVTESDEDEKDGFDDRPPGGRCHRPVTHGGKNGLKLRNGVSQNHSHVFRSLLLSSSVSGL